MFKKRMSRGGSYRFAKRGTRIHLKNLNGAALAMRGGERLC